MGLDEEKTLSRRPRFSLGENENVMRVPGARTLSNGISSRDGTDGLPVVPPTRAQVDAVVEALGGGPRLVECKVPPRDGQPDPRKY